MQQTWLQMLVDMILNVAHNTHKMFNWFLYIGIWLFRPALRKAYHKKSGGSDTTTRLNHDEATNKNLHTKAPQETDVWIPDSRTGIYYPKGQEKVIEGVPAHAAKDYTVNWFNMS